TTTAVPPPASPRPSASEPRSCRCRRWPAAVDGRLTGPRTEPMTPASTPRTRFRERLVARPLLADGGMGTLMFSRGVRQSACLDELAATRPELVGAAHREYLDAGAELIETRSLGANRRRL